MPYLYAEHTLYMNTASSTFVRTAWVFGLIKGIIACLFFVAISEKWIDKSILTTITSSVLAIVTIVLPILKIKTEQENQITLQQGIKMGLAVAAIGAVLYGIYMYIHITTIDPDYVDTIKKVSEKAVYDQPNLSDEEKEAQLAISHKMTSPGLIATFSTLASLFFGFVITMITSAIVKNQSSLA